MIPIIEVSEATFDELKEKLQAKNISVSGNEIKTEFCVIKRVEVNIPGRQAGSIGGLDTPS